MLMRRTNFEYSSKCRAEYCTATFAKRVLCPVFCALKIIQLKIIYRKVYFYLVVNTENCIFVPYKTR